MAKRVLVFRGEEGKRRFTLCLDGLVLGVAALSQQRARLGLPGREDGGLKTEAGLQRKLKKVSKEKDQIDGKTPTLPTGDKARELLDGDQVMFLQQFELSYLRKAVMAADWRSDVTDEIMDLDDWLDASKEKGDDFTVEEALAL